MRAPLVAALAAIAAASIPACEMGTEPSAQGDCLAMVRLDDAYYFSTGEALPTGFTPGQPYATVTANKGCNDVVEVDENGEFEAPDTLVNGESNFLPAGTELYVVEGPTPGPDRIAALADGLWHVLAREPISSFVQGDLRVELTLAPTNVEAPDTVVAQLSYTNLADGEITFTSTMGCLAFAGVFQDTSRISFPATDYACTAAIRHWTLEAGETIEMTWPLEIGDDGVPLDPGTYRFEAILNTHGSTTLVRLFQVL